MTLAVYIGTPEEINERFAGPPSSEILTITAVESRRVFTVSNVSGLLLERAVVINREKAYINSISDSAVTLKEPLGKRPAIGDEVRRYDADYTKYRDQSVTLRLADDVSTGGKTGDDIGRHNLILRDYDLKMPAPLQGNRVTIFESANSDKPVFAGVVARVERSIIGKVGGEFVNQYVVEVKGFQWEADSIGIEEPPFVNINAGVFLKYLMQKYTLLEEGEIDITDSPRVDFIRLSHFRRFSSVGEELAAMWPGSEFVVRNDHTVGKVYFRQKPITYAPITLNDDLINRRGAERVRITKDHAKTYNIVRLPFYKVQWREPDFFLQDTVADDAFLKTSVTLNGQPTSVEEVDLLFDDYTDGDLHEHYFEDDITNPSPPTGFNQESGFLVEGEVNGVNGLHLLDTTGQTVSLGDIGRATDPAETEPFTGKERQLIHAKDIVVNELGDAVILGIIDQTTVLATIETGSTTDAIQVDDVSGFSVDDRIEWKGEKTYITSISGLELGVSPSLSQAPAAGGTIQKHRLAKSRIKFGVLFKGNGDLKYIKDGAETAFDTPRTYTATTYSLRLFMQSFETTISGGISLAGCTLADASNFATGDVVEIFTSGARSEPERRVITKTGSDIAYNDTINTPKTGYRVKTFPKMVLQIKGGAYGNINGRDWTTIYTAENTWQDDEEVDKDAYGVLVALQKSLVGTLTLFKMKDPPAISANVGDRYLHIGTQEIDSAEPDVDCIIRKLGSHYQLDFFPDTKALWGSGQLLELRYQEKFRHDLIEKDVESMRQVAALRGRRVSEIATEDELTKFGGRVLDTIQILPTPLPLIEATKQIRTILDAVKNVGVIVSIESESYSDDMPEAGQILKSRIGGIQDLEIKRVELTEMRGVADSETGKSLFSMVILAGSIERLSDLLLRRQIKSGSRLVIDDGLDDDSFTKLQKTGFNESVSLEDDFTVETCDQGTVEVFDGEQMAKLQCLRMPVSNPENGTITGLLLAITFTNVVDRTLYTEEGDSLLTEDDEVLLMG
jgi:hypothetical protein